MKKIAHKDGGGLLLHADVLSAFRNSENLESVLQILGRHCSTHEDSANALTQGLLRFCAGMLGYVSDGVRDADKTFFEACMSFAKNPNDSLYRDILKAFYEKVLERPSVRDKVPVTPQENIFKALLALAKLTEVGTDFKTVASQTVAVAFYSRHASHLLNEISPEDMELMDAILTLRQHKGLYVTLGGPAYMA